MQVAHKFSYRLLCASFTLASTSHRLPAPPKAQDIVPEPGFAYAATMASPRKTPWQTVQEFAENLVFTEAPRLIEQGIKIGLEVLTGTPSEPTPAIPAGRPVTNTSVPTAHRARKLVYSPDLNGRADPGEIVWTWVAYEDIAGQGPKQGEDRPVLVVGRDRNMLLGLMLSSRQRHAEDTNWVGIGAGSWDDAHRISWVRLDRVLDVPEESIRREGASVQRAVFDVVADRLRRDYSWS